MNRRQFTNRLGAIAALPMMPIKALAATTPIATTAVPNAARFWAIYMTSLHGTCSAKSLQVMTGVDSVTAQGYLSRLVSDGVIKPSRFAANVVRANSKTSIKDSPLKKRLEKFKAAKTEEKSDLLEKVLEPKEPELIQGDDDEPPTV